MDLAEIGERAFSFALVFSVVSTIIVIALLAAGLPPEVLNVPLYIPVSAFYQNVQNLVSKLPQNATITELFYASTSALLGGFVQFVFTLLFGVLALVHTLAMIVPPQVRFLVAPLYFVGAFLQLMIWYYIVTRIFSALKPG